jgi:WD40 repeat protein
MDTHRGDMYIRDVLKTLGHTATINSGCFHPDMSDIFFTCSDDGTVRLWDMTKKLYGVA